MAASNGRKTSDGRKTSAGKKGTARSSGTAKSRTSSRSKKADAARAAQDGALFHEIGLIVLFAAMVLLFFCNFGLIGPGGDAVSGFLFGLFGLTAYVLPILIFLGTAFWFANEGNPNVVRKLAAGTVLFFMIGIICDLLHGSEGMAEYSAAILYEDCQTNKAGGGILAGSLSFFFQHYLGVMGTVLVVFLCCVICLILLTEKSLISSISRMRELSREDAKRRREFSRIRQEEQEQRRAQKAEEHARKEEERRLRAEEKQNEKILRMERKVSGVMLDTALSRPEESSRRDDIHEITLAGDEAYMEPPVQDEDYGDGSYGADGCGAGDYGAGDHEAGNYEAEGYEPEVYAAQTDEPAETLPEELPPIDFDRIRVRGMCRVSSEEAKGDSFKSSREGGDMHELSAPEPEEDTDSAARIHTEQDHSIENNYPMEDIRNNIPEDVHEDIYEDIRRDSAGSIEDGRVSDERQRPVAKLPAKPERARTEPGIPTTSADTMKKEPKPYVFPPISLLQKGTGATGDSERELKETAIRLQQTLATFGVRVTITDISQGPSITRYELQPEQGVKVSKIVGLADDIKLNLAATDIRIEAPIPGKAAVGIEVPNKESIPVVLRDLLEAKEFRDFPSKIAFAVGKDIAGKVVVSDIARMPHMLIAGATGSGKSVCINTLIMSILYKAHPDEVKLIMVDPKVVELSIYNGIPHLLIPVVTDPKKASAALHWGVAEMEDRYRKFADFNVRDLAGYNKKVTAMQEKGDENAPKKLPQIVIIVDELADLMMVCPGEVEESICRLAQLARACGIHLIIATQRPSVDVITGLIKANMPSRAAFAVSSGVDSRTILDMVGAEKLLGKGDMLFYPQGYPKPARIQGAFVSDGEVSDVVDFLKNQALGNTYAEDMEERRSIEEKIMNIGSSGSGEGSSGGSDVDELFEKAGRLIIDKDKASIGMLQRALQIGFNRAARIMDQLCRYGVVGEEEGTKPRKILMSPEEFEELLEEVI